MNVWGVEGITLQRLLVENDELRMTVFRKLGERPETGMQGLDLDY